MCKFSRRISSNELCLANVIYAKCSVYRLKGKMIWLYREGNYITMSIIRGEENSFVCLCCARVLRRKTLQIGKNVWSSFLEMIGGDRRTCMMRGYFWASLKECEVLLFKYIACFRVNFWEMLSFIRLAFTMVAAKWLQDNNEINKSIRRV